MAFRAKRRIRASGGALRGQGMANAGLVLGVVSFATTVILTAAVVNVFVDKAAGDGDGPDGNGPIHFSPDAATRRVAILRAEPGIAWDNLELSGCATIDISGGKGPGDPVEAGDVVSGCVAGETLVIVYKPTGDVIFRRTF